MDSISQDTTGSGVPLKPFSEDQRGRYVLHEEGEGQYSIILDGHVIKEAHHLTTSQVHQLSQQLELANRTFKGSDKPVKPFSEDQRGKYVLHEEAEGHYTITLDGRVIKDTHDFIPGHLPWQQGSTRIALCLDWIRDPGRKHGCYDALPYGSYGPFIERSFDEIKAEFDQHWQEWESSQAKVELEENMAHIIKQQNDLANVVSFGTGTLQDPHLRTRRRSCLQIAALLTMTRCINEGRASENRVPCLSQEPVYNTLDKKLLRSIGIEPVDDPDGFLSVNSKSLVCEWLTYDFVIRKISERPWPAAMITSINTAERARDFQEDPERVNDTIPPQLNAIEARRIYDMLKHSERLPLSAFNYLLDPEPDWPAVLGWHSTIYWRKSSVPGSKEPEDSGDADAGRAQ